MKISYDFRFANLPCGSWPYVSNVIAIIAREYPLTQWNIYHNSWCASQMRIVNIIKDDFAAEHDRFNFIPVKNTCLSLKHHLEFAKFKDDADLYHYLHFDMPLGMKGLPLICTIHDLYPLVLDGYCSPLKKKYFKYICKKNAQRAFKVITVSQNTKNDIINHLGINPDKIEVIYQGHPEQFKPIDDPETLTAIKVKYQLPENFILYTGNHKPHKNLPRLIQAYAKLPKNLRDQFKMVLTGPITAETHELKALALALGIQNDLHFIGMVDFDDLPAIYNLGSMSVMASLCEGFGIPLVESMACGKPVICSNISAMPEVVGDIGRKFDPYDIDSISETLKHTLENDIDNDNLKYINRASQFSWHNTALKTYEIYRQAAASK
ncbi:MAG: glycosyltransferase family 4 protein [Phycisphaerae bacterium]|nr:glycosyltransferase family 4 protein [Phycisphaerae bacterium]